MARIRTWAERDPPLALAVGLALSTVVYAVVWPFCTVSRPPITDLPFHAAQVSILRHYWDAPWHFHEQFTLHPLEVPYLSMYLVGVALSFVVSIPIAVKGMAIVMLLLLPAGSAVLFFGMKKSPLWGLCSLALVWGRLTHWGFLNFVGALGLLAMSVGLALLVADRPTRARKIALASCLLAVFFTHISRVPYALLAVGATAALTYPSTTRLRDVLLPTLPTIALFLSWELLRTQALDVGAAEIRLHPERFGELGESLFLVYRDALGDTNRRWEAQAFLGFGVLAMGAGALFFADARHRDRSAPERRWAIAVTLLPTLLALGFFVVYLLLPLEIGEWWFVYPREATCAAFLALGVAPDLPRSSWLRLAFVAIVAVLVARPASITVREWRSFESATEDFRQILPEVPRAPKLLYLVYRHGGQPRVGSPFLHFPAWVQAEKGGWLSFHFVTWGHSPIRYRDDSPDVPPPVPPRWEWTPQLFRAVEHGAWFDTFLIRHEIDPSELFASDPSVHLTAHSGTWWLFRRQP